MTIGEDDVFTTIAEWSAKVEDLRRLIKWAEWAAVHGIDGVEYQSCPWCMASEKLDRSHNEKCPAFWAGGTPK